MRICENKISVKREERAALKLGPGLKIKQAELKFCNPALMIFFVRILFEKNHQKFLKIQKPHRKNLELHFFIFYSLM